MRFRYPSREAESSTLPFGNYCMPRVVLLPFSVMQITKTTSPLARGGAQALHSWRQGKAGDVTRAPNSSHPPPRIYRPVTHITMSTVEMTTACGPPPSTPSAMTGSVSLTIMLANNRVTRRRCPFWRMGLILLAYIFWSLWACALSKIVQVQLHQTTYGVPLILRTFS